MHFKNHLYFAYLILHSQKRVIFWLKTEHNQNLPLQRYTVKIEYALSNQKNCGNRLQAILLIQFNNRIK